MSFEKYRSQIRAEGWPFWKQKKLAGIKLDDIQAKDLSNDLRQDAVDLYFKGSLSACEAVRSISQRNFSWATVKLYYSVFYFLRATLAVRQVAILRHSNWVYIRAFSEESFCSGSRTSTHECVLTTASTLLRGTDLLLSNTINGENPYLWLKEKRERVNYKDRVFHEPDVADFWNQIDQEKDFVKLLSIYTADTAAIYCFQEEHACLALPLKRWGLTRKDLIDAGVSPLFSEKQTRVLANIAKDSNKLSLFSLLPDFQ